MRRFLLFVTLLFTITAFSQSKGFSRWSFAPQYGYNYFDGDINKSLFNFVPSSFNNITYGASVEYAMTPIWGLSLDGSYIPLRAQNTAPLPMYINTNLYAGSLNLTINFTKWFFPHSTSRFNINGAVGAGYSYYKYDVRDINNVPLLPATQVDFVDVLLKDNSGNQIKNAQAITLPLSLSVEYNLCKSFSVGLKGQYIVFNKDNLEGVTQLDHAGVTNDFVATGSVFLRYKLGAVSKDHLRNIAYDVYDPDKGLLLAKELEGKLNKLSNKVDTVDQKVNDVGAKVANLIPRVEKLENMLSNDGPDADGDGVPDVRDKDPNTPANTPVDFWGKPLPISTYSGRNPYAPVGAGGGQDGSSAGKHRAIYIPDDVPAVYFDFDRIELDDASLITISKIAAKMKSDPTLYVEVRGYCDYSGNNPYNNLLSQRRSDRVKAELVKVWGVAFDHVISNGKGKVIEPRIKYKPNRRCDFFFGRL
jgi:Outer membrane protein and related peptidoglycan-associated (lipo)proteins